VSDRGRIAEVRGCLLHHAEREQRAPADRAGRRRAEQERSAHHRADQVAEQQRPQRIDRARRRLDQRDPPHRERAERERHAGRERHDVPDRVVEGELLEEEERDAAQDDRDRDPVEPRHALADQPRAEQRHPDRRRILDQDRVRGRRELVRGDEQAGRRRERRGGRPLCGSDPGERRPAERVQRRGGDRAARGPDRAGRPIDQLDQDTRAAPEHAAQPQQHERASACGVVTGRQARTRYTICTKRRGLASPGAARARAFVAWWLHLDRT
jgi:hypothetical protein